MSHPKWLAIGYATIHTRDFGRVPVFDVTAIQT